MNNTLPICTPAILDPNASQAKQGYDVYMYIAYVCLLLSYININILVFRFWLILSAIFFIVWGFEEVRAIQVDTLIFNLLFIIINVVQSIPLAKAIWPVKLVGLEQQIYHRDFADHMSERQFKRFISNFHPKMFSAHGSQLCISRSNYEGLIYVAKLNPGWKIALHRENAQKIHDLLEGSWIGTIEHMIYSEKKDKDATVIWGVTAILEEENRREEPIFNTEVNLLTKDNAGCIVYFFDIPTLEKIYNDSTFPFFYRNALKAVWLDYTTKYICTQDLNLIEDDDEEETFDVLSKKRSLLTGN